MPFANALLQMSKTKLYWLFQTVGWLAWAVNDGLIYVNDFGWKIDWLYAALLNVGIAILLTHNYRKIIRNSGWVESPATQVVPKTLIAIALMSLVMVIINLPLDIYLVSDTFKINFDIFTFFQYVLNFAKPLTIWTLFYYAFHYFERKSEIEVEKVRLQSSVRETESMVLRAQMNPHFMFNALNSIRALILEDPEKAQKGITQLSNILRSSLLADRRKTVMLNEEMRTVDDYLALEKIRYEERLQIQKDIAPDTLNTQVPPMLLQTLVENAIKHGVSKPVKGGFVSIKSYILDAKVLIEISNTGVLESTESGGFGLENTAHRLELLFGAESKFEIRQLSKDVVLALVTIPLPLPEPKENPLTKITNIVKIN